MAGKQKIVKAIAATARKLRRTPSLLEFVAHTKYSQNSVFRHFAKWNEAVRAAGLRQFRGYTRPLDKQLLEDWGQTVRKKGAAILRKEYRLAGKYYPDTLGRRFGGWASLPRAFRAFAKGKPEWADVVSLLSPTPPRRFSRLKKMLSRQTGPRPALHRHLRGRTTYGNPINFRGLRHEPVNEQGVVLLFGMLAKEMGYVIEAVQAGFPDCEAKRQIATDRWQRVNIEFEYESKNFREHGHPETGCDVIVCWRHNWAECPKQIDVVELSSVVKSLKVSQEEVAEEGDGRGHRAANLEPASLRTSAS